MFRPLQPTYELFKTYGLFGLRETEEKYSRVDLAQN